MSESEPREFQDAAQSPEPAQDAAPTAAPQPAQETPSAPTGGAPASSGTPVVPDEVPPSATPAAPAAATPDLPAAPTPAPPAASAAAPGTAPTPPAPRPHGPLAERPEIPIEVPRRHLAARSRRDFILFGAGVIGSALAAWWLAPDGMRARLVGSGAAERLDTLAAHLGLSRDRRERTLDRALTFDDDVAEALQSKDRHVRTYDRSQRTPLRNNYNGRTPGPEYLAGWGLQLSGLASGRVERLELDAMLRRFPHREQVTRLVCVEGWSAVAWWGGVRFADLLDAYPPAPGARWAALRSAVNLDGQGRPDPYYVSIDLETARLPQTLLATHQDGQPLTLEHGAPLRLLAPMKLGLKNIKAVTEIAYSAREPADYWNERGYSKYDGL